MARRTNKSQTDNTEKTEEAVVAETATETEAPQAEAKTEVVIDLTDFEAAAKAAVAVADSATGEIALAPVDTVVKEYRKLDGLKAKNAAKSWLGEQMKGAMNDGSIQGARSYLQLQESMSAGSSGGGGSTRTPTDPTEAFVQRAATLRLAVGLVVPGEGVAEDWAEKAKALVEETKAAAEQYLAWLSSDAEDKGDEPEVSAVAKNAAKLSVGRSAKAGGRASGGGGSFTGERRDIGKHIVEAFAGVESGTFLTVAEIRKHQSEEYGDNPPSAGAISARLFPASGNCTVEGIEPGTSDKGHKGATKL